MRKSPENATNVTLHSLVHTFLGTTVEKSQIIIRKGVWTKGIKSVTSRMVRIVLQALTKCDWFH